MKKPNLRRQAIRQRSLARRFLLQTLYQWQICEDEPQTVKANSMQADNAGEIDTLYYHNAFDTITRQHLQYEAQIAPLIPYATGMQQLDPIERAILWIAVYELNLRKDIHPTIVINEAIELAKQFGGSDSYKFINSTLDKLSKNQPPLPPAVPENSTAL